MRKFFGSYLIFLIVFTPYVKADHWGKPKVNGPGPWNENLIVSTTDPNKNNLFKV